MNKINRYDFAKAVVETRVLEKNMISNQAMNKFLQDKNVDDIYAGLRHAGYFKTSAKHLTKNNYDELLMESFEGFVSEVMDTGRISFEFLDLIFLEYDIYNLKTILMKSDNNLNYAGRLIQIPKERMERFESLSQGVWFFHPGKYDVLYEEAAKVYKESGAKALQEYLDRKFFTLLLEISEQSGIPMFMEYSKARIDFYNIMLILRMLKISKRNKDIDTKILTDTMKQYLIGGGYLDVEELISIQSLSQYRLTEYFYQSRYNTALAEGIRVYGYDGDLSILEKYMDNYLIGISKDNQNVPLGPEPVFGYLMGRKYEIINIRIILTSIFLKVPEQIAKERLRDNYV